MATWNAHFWSSLDLNPNVIHFTNVHPPIKQNHMIDGVCLHKGTHPPLNEVLQPEGI